MNIVTRSANTRNTDLGSDDIAALRDRLTVLTLRLEAQRHFLLAYISTEQHGAHPRSQVMVETQNAHLAEEDRSCGKGEGGGRSICAGGGRHREGTVADLLIVQLHRDRMQPRHDGPVSNRVDSLFQRLWTMNVIFASLASP